MLEIVRFLTAQIVPFSKAYGCYHVFLPSWRLTMPYSNPFDYCGFKLSAYVFEVPADDGQSSIWTGTAVIEAEGKRHSSNNRTRFDSEEEAEQQALAIALRIAKGDIPSADLPFRPRRNEDDYLLELNRRLRQHELYEEGMDFLAHPAGAVGHQVMGVARAGNNPAHPAYVLTAQALEAECELVATQRPA
jgi:hypothetical protein